jgi:PST family polysaccharide transporter
MLTPPDVPVSAHRPSVQSADVRSSTRLFEPHAASKDLVRSSVRGAAATGGGQAFKFALKAGSTAILARLLTPEDYGLVAMTTVVVGFIAVFKDAGLTSATVQRSEISHAQISMLFWINTAVGGAIALLLVALSPLISAFYNEPRLQAITVVLATTFLFSGITVQHQALLRRQMRFKVLAILEMLSITAGIIVAVAMALSGFGYWSLVGLNVASAIVNAIGVWLTLHWIPSFPTRGSGVRPLLKFGGDVLSFNVINYFSRQFDTLLIGWFWGPVTLGFYDRAYNMLMMPIRRINGPVAAVAVPALSRARVRAEQFRGFFLNSLQLVTSITVPLVLVLTIYADEIVRLWLGPEWSRCAGIFRLLALAAATGAISNPVGWLLVSLGHTQRYKQMGIFTSAVTVTSFIIGLPFGAEGVARSYSIASLLLFVPTWLFVLAGTGIRPADIVNTLRPTLLSALPAALLALLCQQIFPTAHYGWAAPLVGALCFFGVYAYLLLVSFNRWDSFRVLTKQFGSRAATR